MAKRQTLLSSFFQPKRSKIESNTSESTSTISDKTDTPTDDFDVSNCLSTSSQQNTVTSGESVISQSEEEFYNSYDIGLYINKPLQDDVKHRLLTSPWFPDADFVFPLSGKRGLKFQINWFQRFSWLVYTQCSGGGALCKLCAVFSSDSGCKGQNQKLQSFVTVPFNQWHKAIEKFKDHSATKYHINNVLKADNFISVFNKNHPDIRNTLDISRQKTIAENRMRLVPIIDVIKLCGRQELALRGTLDSGPLDFTGPEPTTNDGNFRALLRMRICNSEDNTKRLFNSAPRNALYTSPRIQNELISICGEIIENVLAKRINAAKCFSVLVDETTDISGIEQMSLCVRYTEKQGLDYILREDFLSYIPLVETTGEVIASKILEKLRSLNINCSYLFGQGYDGAASMSGCLKGVQAVIRKKYPAAFYVHCSSHSLNLAICHASQVHHIRNCFGTVKAVSSFINSSAKRTHILKQKIKSCLPETRWSKLIPMCETRWVENHDGLLRFKEIIVPIVETLEELSAVADIETSSKSSQLLKAIVAPEFVISICTAEVIFKHTLQLCKVLQTVNCDLIQALDLVQNIHSVISNMRQNMDSCFSTIFRDSSFILSDVNGEMKIPRLVGRQTQRCNVPAGSPETYFRVAIAVPFFDDFLEQLSARFTVHKNTISSLQKLLPKTCIMHNFTGEDFLAIKQYYCNNIDEDCLEAEICLWQNKWKVCSKTEELPENAIVTLNQCDRNLFPNVFFLIKVLVTLPVTTASPERSFSTLRRLKTYLRNSVGQNRLNGLALMGVHREIPIQNEEVLERFSVKARRLDFIL